MNDVYAYMSVSELAKLALAGFTNEISADLRQSSEQATPLYTFFTLYVIEDLLKRMSHDQ
jgi:hypothetical protein